MASTRRPAGSTRSIRRGGEPLRQYLDRMWSVALARFEQVAKEAGENEQDA